MIAPTATRQRETEREATLTALVDTWTAHMRWRKNYDRWREDRLWQEDGQTARIRTIERFAGPTTGRRVLDIGSGMGGFVVAAARNGMCAMGIEPNADYCAITRLRGERYGLAPAVARAFGESLPFPDATFHIIIAQDILEHVRDPMATLREIRRVMQPDGTAFLTVINRFAWRDPHYHLRGINWLPRRWADALVQFVGRSKSGARFADNQQLSAMYYDTYRGFKRRAQSLGFHVSDTKECTVAERTTERRGVRAQFLRRLGDMNLLIAAYRAHRFAVASTFEIVLRPGAGAA